MSGAAHQGAPRWLSRTPGVPTLAVTAAGQRETAEEPGGAAAPPPTRRRGSGSGSQQALPESERRCQAQTSGQPPPRKAAGRVRAARAEHRFFFLSLGHCCLELLPAPHHPPSIGQREIHTCSSSYTPSQGISQSNLNMGLSETICYWGFMDFLKYMVS